MSDDVQTLKSLIHAEYEVLCALDPSARRFPCPKFSPQFEPDEAASFLAGLRGEVFDIGVGSTPDGRPLIVYRSAWGGSGRVFGHGQGGRRTFSRESVCTRAARSDLVLRYGWPAEYLESQPFGDKLDFAAHDAGERTSRRVPMLVGEGKTRRGGIEALGSEMERCQGRRPGSHKEGSGHHRKCEGVVEALGEVASVYLWLVSPPERQLLLVTRDGDGGFRFGPAELMTVSFAPLQALLDDVVR